MPQQRTHNDENPHNRGSLPVHHHTHKRPDHRKEVDRGDMRPHAQKITQTTCSSNQPQPEEVTR